MSLNVQRADGGPTDAELEVRFPWIPWRAPLLAVVSSTSAEMSVALCRYCVARDVRLQETPIMRLFAFQEHLDAAHPRPA